jgi:hypothetical protein
LFEGKKGCAEIEKNNQISTLSAPDPLLSVLTPLFLCKVFRSLLHASGEGNKLCHG